MSPTQRSLAKLRKEGWMVAIVEKWNQWAKIRQDLFGFIDLLAVKGDIVMAVQTTSGTNVSQRLAKIQNTQAAATWLESPYRTIVVHGWRLAGARGKRKLWDCREVWMLKEDLSPSPAASSTNPESGQGAFAFAPAPCHKSSSPCR